MIWVRPVNGFPFDLSLYINLSPVIIFSLGMRQSREVVLHLCKVHTDREEQLLFVCLNQSCISKGLLCFHCRSEGHATKDHDVLTINQLKDRAQDSVYCKPVPASVNDQATLIKDVRTKCLASLREVRRTTDLAFEDAEKEITRRFDQLERDTTIQGEAQGRELPPIP